MIIKPKRNGTDKYIFVTILARLCGKMGGLYAGRFSNHATAWHPRCCGVPMWLVEVRRAGTVSQHVFECKVCDKKTVQPADKRGGIRTGLSATEHRNAFPLTAFYPSSSHTQPGLRPARLVPGYAL